MTFVRPLFAVVVLAVAAIGCPQQAPEGSFGDAKPVKNDGSVHKAQPLPEAPPNFEGALVLAPRLQGNALTVELSLKPGYHAYAPGNEIGKPVSLSVDAGSGCELQGAAVVPAGVKKDLGPLGTAVILEGKVEVTATVASTTGCSGILEAQVCTDKACDRPRKHPFKI
jgi:DsbC/DsbD-like thiol-disulfide interchange protein